MVIIFVFLSLSAIFFFFITTNICIDLIFGYVNNIQCFFSPKYYNDPKFFLIFIYFLVSRIIYLYNFFKEFQEFQFQNF